MGATLPPESGLILGYRHQRLPGHIGALAVQPDQELFPRQLRSGDPNQQLTRGVPTVTGLDRSHRRVQQPAAA